MVQSHWELDVFKKATDIACSLTDLSRSFPREELYSLTDQMRKAARSVCANLAEAWRKRCYEAAFVAKLVDSEGEAAETQVWIMFAVKAGYLDQETGARCFRECDEVLRMLVAMRVNSEKWILPPPPAKPKRKSGG
jgi:four helix bundle protein